MARYTGGTKVEGGYYWNTSSWAVQVVSSEGGRLEGAETVKYVKVHFLALFLIVPVLGALFLMFLPFIGFGLFVYAVAKRLTGGVAKGATELASTVQPGSFAAGSAYFTGKEGEGKGAEAPKSPELEKLEKEIAARKGVK